MNSGVLHIFPGSGFESSLLTAVLLGLVVTWLLSETLGWSFSGLVVPGYLASVFIVRPSAGVVVVLEAAITFAIVALCGRFLPRYAGFAPLFGRERFFAMLLTSVGVRAFMEGWALPWLAHLSHNQGIPIDDGSGLYAVGLVIVPLLANVIWVPGVLRGSKQILTTTLITFLLLRLVLLPHTNLMIGDFELSFEDIAASFAASPKAYLVLTTSALLTTLVGRRLHWDVGGTLVPGLLAVAWLTPEKALATLFEVTLALLLASPLRRIGVLRGATASRRLITAFLILYAVRYAIAGITDNALPGMHVSDLWGLGYVLPALLVERIWAVGKPLYVATPTLILSIGGTLIGGLGSVALEQVAPSGDMRLQPAAVLEQGPTSLQREVARAHLQVATQPPHPKAPALGPADLVSYRAVMRALVHSNPESANRIANRAGLVLLVPHTGEAREPTVGVYVLREPIGKSNALRGFGSVIVFTAKDHSGPLLEIPYPNEEPYAAAAALTIANGLKARAILFGGVGKNSQRGDPSAGRTSPQAIARQMLEAPSLRLRQGKQARLSGSQTMATQLSPLLTWLPQLKTTNSPGRSSTLALTASQWRRLLARDAAPLGSLSRQQLRGVLKQTAEQPPAPMPVIEEFAQAVVSPALRFACRPKQLPYVQTRVQALGYQISSVNEGQSLLLYSSQYGLGILLKLCQQDQSGYLLQVPRPHREPGSLQVAEELFHRLPSKVLLFASNPGGQHLAPLDTLLRRSSKLGDNIQTLVIRGMAKAHPIPQDIVLGTGALRLGDSTAPPLLDKLQRSLNGLGLTTAVADNQPVYGFTLGSDGMGHLRRQSDVAVLWTQRSLRQRASQTLHPRLTLQQHILPLWQGSAEAFLQQLGKDSPTAGPAAMHKLLQLSRSFAQTPYPGLLRELKKVAAQHNGRVALWQPQGSPPQIIMALRHTGTTYLAAISQAQSLGGKDLVATSLAQMEHYLQRGDSSILVTLTTVGAP